jgi:glutathione S-transferase
MTMHLYQNPASSNARRVVMTALILGTELELITIDLKSPADREKLVVVNANSKIPVLVDDGLVLNESCAIMQYLCEGTPGQALWPQDRRLRADVNRWMFWCAQHFAPALGTLSWENFIKPLIGLGGPDPAEVSRGQAELARFAAVLDAHLAGRRWVAQTDAGPGLTLADLTIAATLMHAGRAQASLQPYENVRAWYAGIQQLDAWRRTEFVLPGQPR